MEKTPGPKRLGIPKMMPKTGIDKSSHTPEMTPQIESIVSIQPSSGTRKGDSCLGRPLNKPKLMLDVSQEQIAAFKDVSSEQRIILPSLDNLSTITMLPNGLSRLAILMIWIVWVSVGLLLCVMGSTFMYLLHDKSQWLFYANIITVFFGMIIWTIISIILFKKSIQWRHHIPLCLPAVKIINDFKTFKEQRNRTDFDIQKFLFAYLKHYHIIQREQELAQVGIDLSTQLHLQNQKKQLMNKKQFKNQPELWITTYKNSFQGVIDTYASMKIRYYLTKTLKETELLGNDTLKSIHALYLCFDMTKDVYAIYYGSIDDISAIYLYNSILRKVLSEFDVNMNESEFLDQQIPKNESCIQIFCHFSSELLKLLKPIL
ncbi:MAG: hypothetical protein HQK77_15080 [Desulfobacterales bacterium]|nr:hypothetical protein [Desulfobacterales bacterium]